MHDREYIYKAIKADITSGRLQPHERLLETKLAEQYGVSRSPIREAIRQLEIERLVTVEKRKGATVTKLSIAEVNEIYSLRTILEGYSASLAVKRFTSRDRTALEEFKQLLIEYADASRHAQWLEVGIRFHAYFSKNSGNLTLSKYIEDLVNRVHRYQYIVTTNTASLAQHTAEHLEIIEAALAADPELTRKKMQQHLRSVHAELEKILNRFPAL